MYSCSSSECKELLASLGWREVAQALDDPPLVVTLTKFRQRASQFPDVLEYPDPQQLLLQRANEPLDAAVTFRLSHERRLITDSSGANIGEQGHYPYGELLYPSSPVTKLILTGKERDSESNLDNFGARYYSSQYGRFMTPDPASIRADIEDFSDPQGWNGYAYVRNNPLNLTDPSGESYQICVQVSNPDNPDGPTVKRCTTVSDDQFSNLKQDPGSGISLSNGVIYATDANGVQIKAGTYYQTDVDLDPGVASMLYQAGTGADAGVKAAMIATAPEYLAAAGGAVAVELAGESTFTIFEGTQVVLKEHAVRRLGSDALKATVKAAIEQAIRSGQIRYIGGGTFIGRIVLAGQQYISPCTR